MKALFDTNIVIDYLNGITLAKTEINQYQTKFISIITWIEVLVGASAEETNAVKNFLQQFKLIAIDSDIAHIAVKIRKTRRIRLPDAIIWASAEKNDCMLVTRNTKDFPENMPFVRVPYQLKF